MPSIDLVLVNSYLDLTQGVTKDFALTFFSNISIASKNLYKDMRRKIFTDTSMESDWEICYNS